MGKATSLILILGAISCTTATVNTGRDGERQSGECTVGARCSLSGRLEVLFSSKAAAGRLQIDDHCYALALPQSVLDNKQAWANKPVLVSGKVYEDPQIVGSVDLLVVDRWVYEGVCSNDEIIYVETIMQVPAQQRR